MIPRKIAIVSAIAQLLAIQSAVAAEQTESLQSLDEIIVTSTRLNSSLRETAQSVSLVSKDQIQNGQQMLGLDESLARVPGLYMQNRYNFAQDLRIALRGFGSRSSFGVRGIRIIVDGVPETLPDGQAQVDSIDIGSTDRIEVIRGPSSSLYGNASGGVISIHSELGSETPSVEAQLAGGDYEFRQYRFKAVGSVESLDYLLSASRTELEGYRDASRAEGTSINSKLAFRPTARDELQFSFNHTDQPLAQDPGGIDLEQATLDRRSARDRNLLYDAGESLRQQRIGGVYRTDRVGGELLLRNYYVWRDFSNRLPFTNGGSVDLDRFFYGAGVQYSSEDFGSRRLRFVTGLDLDRQDDDRIRFDNNEGNLGAKVFDQNEVVSSDGIYLQAQLKPSERWSLFAGARFDKVEFEVVDRFLIDGDDSGRLDFEHWSPSLGASYAANFGTVFASWRTSFETPTTTELANPDGTGGFNTLLRPQQADSLEFGVRAASDSIGYELVVFHIDLEDELVPFEVAASPGRTFFANAGKSTRNGVEAALSWSISDSLDASLSYTWSDFVFDEFTREDEDFAGKTLPGVPGSFGYFGLNYRSAAGLMLAFDVVYSGRLFATNDNSVSVGSYTVANLRFSYEWNSGNWLVRPYIGVNNLFDELYNSNIRINAFGDRFYEPAPERNVYAGVVVKFRGKNQGR